MTQATEMQAARASKDNAESLSGENPKLAPKQTTPHQEYLARLLVKKKSGKPICIAITKTDTVCTRIATEKDRRCKWHTNQ